MLRKNSGFQAKVKEAASMAFISHCMIHREALALKNSAEQHETSHEPVCKNCELHKIECLEYAPIQTAPPRNGIRTYKPAGPHRG